MVRHSIFHFTGSRLILGADCVGDGVYNEEAMIKINDKKGGVIASVWVPVYNSVRASVRASVWNSACKSVYNPVHKSVGNSTWRSIGGIIGKP